MRIHVIDSHTGGEPTRVLTAGGPDLVSASSGSMAERRDRFRTEFDHIRSAAVNEPRASDAVVGALLCEPVDPACAAGVIFFNNVGYIGMCGHGTIGLLVTLAHMGRIQPGVHTIETTVGRVTAELHGANEVSVTNVPSYRLAKGVAVEVAGHGQVVGDVAWGGNWFFLVDRGANALQLADIDDLTEFTWRIREALVRQGVTGADGAEIDHIELFTSSTEHATSDSRNFVLCPGGAYDRSPCGTGTSAKLACLAADGKLEEGMVWRQESIVGSVFEARYKLGEVDGRSIVHPTIRGSAYITAEADLILDEKDPFRWGIRR